MPFFNKELSKAIMTRTKKYVIISCKKRVREIESFMQSKETFASLF